MVKILEAFAACKNLAARMDHSFYYHPILEQAIDQFKTPEGLEGLDADRFDLARAGCAYWRPYPIPILDVAVTPAG